MRYIEHDNNGMVTFEHCVPFDAINGLDKTQTELEQTGLLVDDIPSKTISGTRLYVNPETKELWYQ
jgi:hypothetical protein